MSQWSALNRLGPVAVVAIAIRAHYRCAWCGLQTIPGRRHVDHVVPRALGGDDSPGNLVLSCAKCNLSRLCDEIPARAFHVGRTREQIEADIARQTRTSIAPGSEIWKRAVWLAPVVYPAQVARRRRNRAAYLARAAGAFFDEVAACA